MQITYVKMGELRIKAFSKMTKYFDYLFENQSGFLNGICLIL